MAEVESPILPAKRPHETQPGFLPSFLYKTVFFVAIIAIIPFFPSQAPEFVNQSILSRGWELFHLLIVGVAISYGLFSRRNANHPEAEKDREPPPKVDTPQSFVFRLLQVSSVFDDDESERPETPSGASDDSKMQTWSSQYHGGNPVVVVAEGERSNAGENGKPLYLPVRSLKSHPQGSELIDSSDEIDGYSCSDEGSRLVSSGMDEISRKGSFRASDGVESEDEAKEGVVLPSPIPWRSRSGRMEVNNSPFAGIGIMPPSPPSYRLPAVMDANPGPARTPSFRSSGSHSAAKLPPLQTLSPEMRDKTSEDSVKKKGFSKVSPPPVPPPPPPPPPVSHGSSYLSDRKDTMSRRSRNSFQRNDTGIDPSRYETRPRSHTESSSSTARSVRTVRCRDAQGTMMEKGTETTTDEPLLEFRRAIHQPPPPPLSPEYQTEKKNADLEKVIVESDDSETNSDAESNDVEDASSSAMEAEPDENEVDKKADEFIAKFREQIRLQRIESIKRSTGHRSVRNPK